MNIQITNETRETVQEYLEGRFLDRLSPDGKAIERALEFKGGGFELGDLNGGFSKAQFGLAETKVRRIRSCGYVEEDGNTIRYHLALSRRNSFIRALLTRQSYLSVHLGIALGLGEGSSMAMTVSEGVYAKMPIVALVIGVIVIVFLPPLWPIAILYLLATRLGNEKKRRITAYQEVEELVEQAISSDFPASKVLG